MKYTFKFINFIAVLLFTFADSFSWSADKNRNVIPSVIDIQDGLLTIQARNIPVKEIFQKIAVQANVEIIVQGSVESAVSAEFAHTALEDGLRRITQDFNSVFMYGTQKPGQIRPPIEKILLYAKLNLPKGTPPTIFSPGGSAVERPAGSLQKIEHAPMAKPDQDQPEEDQDQPSMESIAELMESEDDAIREEAVGLLAGLEDGSGVELLTEVLQNDKSGEIRKLAVEVLGNTGSEKAVQALGQALRDKNAEVRSMAVYALGQFGGNEAIALIKKAKNDASEEVRQAAADALEMAMAAESQEAAK